jgi:glycine cleavage system H protein
MWKSAPTNLADARSALKSHPNLLWKPAMPDDLQLTSGKFTFHVATDRWYSEEGMWAKQEGKNIRVGLSDFLQQSSGDVAFAEPAPAGTRLAFGEEAARIETIKIDISLGTPVAGRVLETNPALETSPDIINRDPYGEGWLLIIETSDWEKDKPRLLDAKAYFKVMEQQVRAEKKDI